MADHFIHPVNLIESAWSVDDVEFVNSGTIDPAIPPSTFIQDLGAPKQLGGELIYSMQNVAFALNHVMDWWRLKYYISDITSVAMDQVRIRVGAQWKDWETASLVSGWNTVQFAGGEALDIGIGGNQVSFNSSVTEDTNTPRITGIYIHGQSTGPAEIVTTSDDEFVQVAIELLDEFIPEPNAVWNSIPEGIAQDASKPYRISKSVRSKTSVRILFVPDDLEDRQFRRYRKDSLIVTGQVNGYMYAYDQFVPKLRDVVVWDGVNLTVAAVDKIAPVKDTVLYFIEFKS